MKARDGLRIAARALTGHMRIPLDLLRAAIPDSDKFSVDIQPQPPGVWVSGSTTALGAPLRFSGLVLVEGIDYDGDHRRLHLRLRNVSLETDADASGPLAATIRDGSIDTARPGDLIGNMPRLPAFVTEAAGERIVIDLLAIPRLAEHPHVRALLAVGSSLVGFTAIEVLDDVLEIKLSALPAGAGAAVRSALRNALTGDSK